ncbi:hypothetical protein [Chitinophaga filiformis]|uniref:Uncharacterized protein n=1 Tax=Chitinophaga filiformis TaxID=104663 RepID=A0ABY4HX47_CHIFI|nr:hypothetical protein [Chitinophaga filiformis]UPK67965.1 hypothetical protein MYF79_23720 [Chitinophaga filiformis]
MEANSIKNQKIKGAFVNANVIANVSQIVEYILQTSVDNNQAPFSYDDLENLYHYEDTDGNCYTAAEKDDLLEELQQELESLQELQDESEDERIILELESKVQDLRERIDQLDNAEEVPSEVYEWWIVSHWLGNKLKDNGEVIIYDGMHTYWGRCTTGQAILLDSVIAEICTEMEILDGQRYAWE